MSLQFKQREETDKHLFHLPRKRVKRIILLFTSINKGREYRFRFRSWSFLHFFPLSLYYYDWELYKGWNPETLRAKRFNHETKGRGVRFRRMLLSSSLVFLYLFTLFNQSVINLSFSSLFNQFILSVKVLAQVWGSVFRLLFRGKGIE